MSIPALNNYITSARAAGKTDEEIRANFIAAGWSKAVVDKSFKEMRDRPVAVSEWRFKKYLVVVYVILGNLALYYLSKVLAPLFNLRIDAGYFLYFTLLAAGFLFIELCFGALLRKFGAGKTRELGAAIVSGALVTLIVGAGTCAPFILELLQYIGEF